MSTLSAARPAVKSAKTRRPQCSIRIESGMRGENAGTIAITSGKLTSFYEAWRLDAAFGEAWQLTKLLPGGAYGEQYNVLLCGQESNCDCPGCTYKDHCKHVDGLMALAQKNLI